MKVLPGVDLVGSGFLGMSLTDRDDCHVFLVASGGEALLVDAGCGAATDAIVARIEAAGTAPDAISRIVVTHAHPDHSAGAAGLARRLGADVVAAGATAEILRRGDEDAAGLTAARSAGLYPAPVRLDPTPVTTVVDGDVLQVGAVTVRVLVTPGHAAGHLCLLADVDGRRVLFSGDLVFARGRVAVLATPDTDLGALSTSLERVRAAEPDVLLPGHGSLVLADATSHLQIAVDAFARQQLPPPLLP